MSFAFNIPLISIMLPLIGAMLTPFFRKSKSAAAIINGLILLVLFALNICLLITFLNTGESFNYMMGHFPAPFGNELRAGLLEALLASVFPFVMYLSLSGGRRWIYRDISGDKHYLYYLMMNLLMCSMMAIIYTNDLFTGYVFTEINTISACAIIMIRDSEETVTATIKYLIMSLLGSGFLLFGIVIIYDLTGHLLMENIHEQIVFIMASGNYYIPLLLALGLFSAAMAVKSALFPFHTWLPDAHTAATTSSSGVLSGLVIKTYIIFLLKIIFRVFGHENVISIRMPDVLFVLGVIAMIVGSVDAYREIHLKRMIAFSSVAQVGYIFMGIGLGNTLGIIAAVFHILSHAVTKPMLFIAGTALSQESGHGYSLRRLRGSAHKNLLAGMAFTTGSLSLVGIPLFAGFPSKMYLAISAAGEDTLKMAVAFGVLGISTLLNALYYIPACISIWRDAEDMPELSFKERLSPGPYKGFPVAMVVFMACNILLGIFFVPVMDIIGRGVACL